MHLLRVGGKSRAAGDTRPFASPCVSPITALRLALVSVTEAGRQSVTEAARQPLTEPLLLPAIATIGWHPLRQRTAADIIIRDDDQISPSVMMIRYHDS